MDSRYLKRLLQRSLIVPEGMPPDVGGERVRPDGGAKTEFLQGGGDDAESGDGAGRGAQATRSAPAEPVPRLRRPWDLRARLVAAMVGVAIVSVLLATLASDFAVNSAVVRFGRQDLDLSAKHTAAVAAHFYAEHGGWTAADVRELVRLERVELQTVVVRDRAGRVVAGSTTDQAMPRAVEPVRVHGRGVGTISLAHVGGGDLRGLSQALQGGPRSPHPPPRAVAAPPRGLVGG